MPSSTGLDPSEILYGTLTPRYGEDCPALRDSDGRLLYEHYAIGPLEWGSSDYSNSEAPVWWFTSEPGIKTWDQAIALRVVHRLGGPAAIWRDGREAWYRNGLLHREDGPARVIWCKSCGDYGYQRRLYYLDGKRVSQKTISRGYFYGS